MNVPQEIAFILYLQRYTWALPFMRLATSLGSFEFYVAILPAVYWCFDYRLGFRLALILVTSRGLNDVLKIGFHSPRPYWISSKVMAYASSGTFGMPSGHAQDAICFWGLLASHFRGMRAWSAAFVMVFVIGLSRIYLGVHFPGDVVAGWGAGTLILAIFLPVEPRANDYLDRRSLWQKVLISFISSVAMLALCSLSITSLKGWHVPSPWYTNAFAAAGQPIDPLSPVELAAAAGSLLGMGAGYSWIIERGGFETNGKPARLLARYLIGLGGLLIIWYGMGFACSTGGLMLCYAISYLRVVAAGIWIAAAAPVLFMKIGVLRGPERTLEPPIVTIDNA
jgi:membrane-associated phospholipid phosphatase